MIFLFCCIGVSQDLCFYSKDVSKCPRESIKISPSFAENWTDYLTSSNTFYFADDGYDSIGIPVVFSLIGVSDAVDEISFVSMGSMKKVFFDASFEYENPKSVHFIGLEVFLVNVNSFFNQITLNHTMIVCKGFDVFTIKCLSIESDLFSMNYVRNSLDSNNIVLDVSQDTSVDIFINSTTITNTNIKGINKNSSLFLFGSTYILQSSFSIVKLMLNKYDGTHSISFNPETDIVFNVVNVMSKGSSLFPSLRIFSHPKVLIDIPEYDGEFEKKPIIGVESVLNLKQSSPSSSIFIYPMGLVNYSMIVEGNEIQTPPMIAQRKPKYANIIGYPEHHSIETTTRVVLESGSEDENYITASGDSLSVLAHGFSVLNSKNNVFDGSATWKPIDLSVKNAVVQFQNLDLSDQNIAYVFTNRQIPLIKATNLVECGNNVLISFDQSFNSTDFLNMIDSRVDLICSPPVRHCNWGIIVEKTERVGSFVEHDIVFTPSFSKRNNTMCFGFDVSPISNVKFTSFCISTNSSLCSQESKVIQSKADLSIIQNMIPEEQCTVTIDIFGDLSPESRVFDFDFSQTRSPIELHIINQNPDILTDRTANFSYGSFGMEHIHSIRSHGINILMENCNDKSIRMNNIILEKSSINPELASSIYSGTIEICISHILKGSVFGVPLRIKCYQQNLNITYQADHMIMFGPLLQFSVKIMLPITIICYQSSSIRVYAEPTAVFSLLSIEGAYQTQSLSLFIEKGFPISTFRNQFAVSAFSDVDVTIDDPRVSFKNVFSQDTAFQQSLTLRTSISSINLCKSMSIPKNGILNLIPLKPLTLDYLSFQPGSSILTVGSEKIQVIDYHLQQNAKHLMPENIQPINIHIGKLADLHAKGDLRQLSSMYFDYSIPQIPNIIVDGIFINPRYLEMNYLSQLGSSFLRRHSQFFSNQTISVICAKEFNCSQLKPFFTSSDPDFRGETSILHAECVNSKEKICLSLKYGNNEPSPHPPTPEPSNIPTPSPSANTPQKFFIFIGLGTLIIVVIVCLIICSINNEENVLNTVPLLTQEGEKIQNK